MVTRCIAAASGATARNARLVSDRGLGIWSRISAPLPPRLARVTMNSMPTGPLTDDQVRDYHRDGYVLARGMFDPEEISLIGQAARQDRALDQHSFGRADGEGGTVRLSLWNHPGDSIYGMVARCERVVGSAEKILEGEVYHYHSKMIMKDARVGGAWTWHQDYGYWYQNGVLFPLLCSAFIAVDPATRENGCLQVIRGSHHLDRKSVV